MFKNIFFTFFILIFGFFSQNVFSADSISVENIFSDIDENYKYIDQLQVLYDKWMVKPDSEWKFSPLALLNRDEFVWILMEVTCKKCIQPNVDLDIIKQYENTQLFYDISKENKYFYCIASADNDWYVQGYQEWSTCDDWTFSEWEKPFCASNTINLEEAIAVVLRASWIMTRQEAEKIEKDIYNGIITEPLSNDVSPKNIDGSVYSFYPYLQKALEYEIVEVDTNGNVVISTLIEITDWKIRPKQYISKEDFLQIAYLALRTNSCNQKEENALSLKINIYSATCSKEDANCELVDLNNDNNIYDFGLDVYSTCELWIPNPEWYIWRFYNNSTWEEIKKYWKYIDNYTFLSDWEWLVFLRVIDNCWNTGEVYNTININNINIVDWDFNNLNVSIIADPISWEWPLLVDFEALIWGGKWPYNYIWDFWDGNNWFWKNIKNIYKEKWVYKVLLTVIDNNWFSSKSTVLIKIIWESSINIDTDKDWIYDSIDLCPLVKWDIRNKGCPILEEECSVNNKCSEGYICSSTNICLPKKVENSCEYSWWDVIFWNMVCNSCPCNYFLDFTSTLRKCDLIFPAITSKDSKTIYSKWEMYQIE